MNYYHTPDIQIAATLLAAGHPLVGTTRSEDRAGRRARVLFHFEDTDELRKVTMDYHNDRLRLPPRELFGRLRALKAICHEVLGT